MPIVTTPYRYKRLLRRKKASVMEVPVIVTKASKRTPRPPIEAQAAVPAAEAPTPRIVAARRKPAASIPPGLLPETPEEHRRRRELAGAVWRDLVRAAAGQQGP